MTAALALSREGVENRRLAGAVRSDEHDEPRRCGQVGDSQFGEPLVIFQVYVLYSHSVFLAGFRPGIP